MALTLGDWVRAEYQRRYCDEKGNRKTAINWDKFTAILIKSRPDQEEVIRKTVKILRKKTQGLQSQDKPPQIAQPPQPVDVKGRPVEAQNVVAQNSQADTTKAPKKTSGQTSSDLRDPLNEVSLHKTPNSSGSSLLSEAANEHQNDLLSRKMKDMHVRSGDILLSEGYSNGTGSTSNGPDDEQRINLAAKAKVQGPNFDRIDLLLAAKTSTRKTESEQQLEDVHDQIRAASLISGDIISSSGDRMVPQYGFLGSYADADISKPESKLFLNTNAPFSAFICGVQGSGKSHTTSCILENALLSSDTLGRTENPVSALVFSYGEFNSDGSGYNISEAAFLAASDPDFPGHNVKKITVLTSPSNAAIGKLYRRIPNVTVTPFKLKAESLDIGAMLTLMNVHEKSEAPLYMAKVESVLRELASKSETSAFDYQEFKMRLRNVEFDPKQTSMLEQRLGLLESFLDMDGTCPEPEYAPAEVTIIDLSCPFVSANTACILFKLCLQRYLRSVSAGKMIVLDEAHKYMLKVPGAKALMDYLHTITRLERHYGVRLIISTQEPTLMTDLIALCSITVIHRFSSPEWLCAIKKHIPVATADKEDLLSRIEALTTGTALVYSPKSVLGKNGDGDLVRGIGQLLKLDIRRRVTYDGGQSVLCV